MRYLIVVFFLIAPFLAQAVEPDEILQDPALELRAREISRDLRCVVCQNEDIDSSNAGVARDLRIIVRERLVAGDSDQDVLDYVQARYGDYVLMSPPLNTRTLALWFAPPILALIAFMVGFFVLKGAGRSRATNDLSEEDEDEVSRFIEAHKSEDQT